jgi:hypothetical protein
MFFRGASRQGFVRSFDIRPWNYASRRPGICDDTKARNSFCPILGPLPVKPAVDKASRRWENPLNSLASLWS